MSPKDFSRLPADVANAYARLLRKHFDMAADQHRDYPSDRSLKKHDDDYRQAEDAFLALLLTLTDELAALRLLNPDWKPVPELAGTCPVVLYLRDTQDRDELIAALKAAKPGMITRSL